MAYQNIATKVLTGEVRLSYCNLTSPRASTDGGEAKYSVTILIPKSDTATVADIEQSMKAAYEVGVSKKWGGARPQKKQIVHNGDGLRPSGLPFGEECKGHWVLTASSRNKPQVVGIDNINCELAPNDIYSGMYARVTINFYPFDRNGNKGVGCGLGNVLKTRDGEALSGGATAASDFAELSVIRTREGDGEQETARMRGVPKSANEVQYDWMQPTAANIATTDAFSNINPVTGLPM